MADDSNYLLVDGYNIIFAWEELKDIALESLETARIKLIDTLSNYGGLINASIIIVFDAHKVKDNVGSIQKIGNVTVIYTKETQTADEYIELCAKALSRKYNVKVATSDGLEQIIVLSQGAIRVSASELFFDVMDVKEEMRKKYTNKRPVKNNMLFDNLDDTTKALLEKMRRNT